MEQNYRSDCWALLNRMNPQMKIVQLIYSLSSGGAEKFVVNLSNELSRMGHDVCVCILREANEVNMFNRPFLDENVKFVSIGIKEGFSLRKVKTVEKFLKEFKPDVVHSHLNVIPYVFRYSLMHRGVRFVYTLHSVAQYASGAIRQKPFNRFFFRKGFIQPVTISGICDQSYRSYYGMDNAVKIDNGAPSIRPTDGFQKVKEEVSALCGGKRLPVFIHVARFHPLKNQSLLVNAFNKLNSDGHDFRLLIAGQGFSSDEGFELQKKACGKIVFLGEKSNVGDYLLCADAFCLSSEYEGLPISLLEAMSCGLTPVCTAVGGIPDVIEDGVNGYLDGEMTVSSYCDVLLKCLEHPIPAETIKESYSKNFSMEICAKKYVEVYKG